MNEKILFTKKLSSMQKTALISFSGLLYWPVSPILQVLCGLADSNSHLPCAQKIADLLLSHLKRCPSPRPGHTGLGTYMGTGCSPLAPHGNNCWSNLCSELPRGLKLKLETIFLLSPAPITSLFLGYHLNKNPNLSIDFQRTRLKTKGDMKTTLSSLEDK